MPINTSSLLLNLKPPTPIDLSPLRQLGGGGGQSLERERLRLMREQFEETRRKNKEDEALARLQEQGRTAREQMQLEAQAAAKAAEERAALMKRRQDAVAEFGKLNAAGDIEGARGLVPFMTSLGVEVDLEGEEAGLPRYRIDVDPESTKAAATDRAMDGGDIAPEENIGYPADDTGVLEGSTTSYSAEEAFNRARLASAYSELSGGLPIRQSPQEDFTGAVPNNVIDVGAMQAATAARLNPALSGLIGAYPEPYRDSARQTAAAVQGTGLPANKAIEQFDKLRGGPDSLIRSEMEAQAAQGRFDQTQATAKSNESEDRYRTGYATVAKEVASKFGIEDLPTAQEQTQRAIDILSNDVDSDDSLVLALISRRMGERGATTEGDIRRATGMEAQAWLDQLKSWIQKGVEGGLPTTQKNAILGVLKEMQGSDEKRYERYMGALDEIINDPETDRDVARGVRAYARISVPKATRERLEQARRGTAEARDGDFDRELERQAKDAGLDPAKIRGVIGKESGGNADAKNPQSSATGLIQFLEGTAQSLGTSTEELRKMSAAEQVPFVIKYLSGKGLTAESDQGDYYVAIAAPAFVGKPDETKVYEKGSPEYDKNPSWDLDKDGVITVGDLKRWGGGKRTADSGDPANDKVKRAEELLRKAGYAQPER